MLEGRGVSRGVSLFWQACDKQCYHRCVIIDFHTHIFPPEVRENRESFLQADPTFHELYASPKAMIATADDLLLSMDEAGVQASVALGFAWQTQEMCVRHNDYILEAAAKSGGRIIPFCTLNPALGPEALLEGERCAHGGAQGLGELRPENQGFGLGGPSGEALAALAREQGLLLLFHVSEPVGHSYPGKRGLSLGAFYGFAVGNPDLPLIGAHLAGGLPLYAHMPAVAQALKNIYFDTAAVPFLYGEDIYQQVVGPSLSQRLLFGSDFPLIGQQRQLDAIRRNVPSSSAQAMALGDNAARLLGYGERS